MPNWDQKFKAEYDYARAKLIGDDGFAREWRPLVARLRKLMSDAGFDAGEAAALDELRVKSRQGASQTRVAEDAGFLKAVNAWTGSPTGTVSDEARLRVAALKLLSHVYLLNKAGDRKVWIHSLPKEFTEWATDAFWNVGTNSAGVCTLLKTRDEQFSEQQKRYLANSVQQSLAWCQKTGIVLANAASSSTGANAARTTARAQVSRWFAEPGLSDATLDTYIATLAAGFKKVIATLNRGHFLLTDWVPLRNASVQADIDFLLSEAFTFAGNGEGLDVVYIEKSFFTRDAGGVVHDQKNWTRIVVHELTHLAAGTDDVTNGDVRYAHYGIGPHSGFPGSDAVQNADSWAFFAADCAGVLTDSERAKALRIR
jgi:hypothetical protein